MATKAWLEMNCQKWMILRAFGQVSYPQTCDECLASGKCLAVPVLKSSPECEPAPEPTGEAAAGFRMPLGWEGDE